MNNEELYKRCQAAAALIVAAEHKLWPLDTIGFDFGGGSSTQQSNFARKGTSDNAISYALPSFLQDLISGNASSTASDPALASKQTNLLSSLMTKSPDALPGANVLSDNMAIAPTSFTGASTLEKISARDPFSTQFENDTQAAYEQRASDAMSMAATGPDAVRGGNARTGVAQGVLADRLAQGRGDEVRKAQLQDSGVVQGASQLFSQIEQARRGTAVGAQGQKAGQVLTQDQNALGAAKQVDQRKIANLAALQMASDMLGTKKGVTKDDMSGAGNQTNDSFNWGVNVLGGCCFIFLQALNGHLPWFIEAARHDYYTPVRRHGYKWMANWLVPAMAHHRWVARLVNTVIIRPFLHYGAWLYYDRSGGWRGFMWGPYCELWLRLWSVLGVLCARKEVG